MATTDSAKSLDDPEFKAELQRLRRTDNLTNWYYVARTYLYLAAVIAGAVWVFELARADAISVWWTVPVALLAIVLVGAGQHQLSGLAHEGVHHILFRNRLLNDLASDLLTMFPLFSATHLYRLQHLAHHQFVNDPDRDPDVSQLRTSGHWLDFPVTPRQFLGTLVKQLWVPKLIRFMRVRARYNATGAEHSPYFKKGLKPNRTAVRTTWLVHEDAVEGRDYRLEEIMPFWQLTSEQDWTLCELAQKGVSSSHYLPGPFSTYKEYNVDAFLRWCLQKVSCVRL